MDLIIDASNIKTGGGRTHLIELIENGFPGHFGYSKVYIWASQDILNYLEDKDWLVKMHHIWLEGGYFKRLLWKKLILNPFIKKSKSLLYIPGTGYSKYPFVTMCRNLLPLQWTELNRYFFSFMWIRLVILRFLHFYAYKKALSVIFLNDYCQKIVSANIKLNNTIIIPHGLSESFKTGYPKKTLNSKLKFIYVSTVDVYKHQWNVAEAFYQLIDEGLDIELILIGESYKKALNKLKKVMKRNKDKNQVKYLGKIDYSKLPEYYSNSDVFIFASTCETFGMVLLEAMGSGLPVLCSDKSSMKEMLGNSAKYFDPLSIQSIKNSVVEIYNRKSELKKMSEKSIELAAQYSWENCAYKTFQFLSETSKKNHL